MIFAFNGCSLQANTGAQNQIFQDAELVADIASKRFPLEVRPAGSCCSFPIAVKSLLIGFMIIIHAHDDFVMKAEYILSQNILRRDSVCLGIRIGIIEGIPRRHIALQIFLPVQKINFHPAETSPEGLQTEIDVRVFVPAIVIVVGIHKIIRHGRLILPSVLIHLLFRQSAGHLIIHPVKRNPQRHVQQIIGRISDIKPSALRRISRTIPVA